MKKTFLHHPIHIAVALGLCLSSQLWAAKETSVAAPTDTDTAVSTQLPTQWEEMQHFSFEMGLINSNYSNQSPSTALNTGSNWLRYSFLLRFSPLTQLSTQIELPILNVVDSDRNESAFVGAIGSFNWELWSQKSVEALQSKLFLSGRYSLLSPQLQTLFSSQLLLKQQDQIGIGIGYRQSFAPAVGELRLNVTQAFSLKDGLFYYPIISPELSLGGSLLPELSFNFKTLVHWTLGSRDRSILPPLTSSVAGMDLLHQGYWNLVFTPSISYKLTELMHLDLAFAVPIINANTYQPAAFSDPLLLGLWGGEARFGIHITL